MGALGGLLLAIDGVGLGGCGVLGCHGESVSEGVYILRTTHRLERMPEPTQDRTCNGQLCRVDPRVGHSRCGCVLRTCSSSSPVSGSLKRPRLVVVLPTTSFSPHFTRACSCATLIPVTVTLLSYTISTHDEASSASIRSQNLRCLPRKPSQRSCHCETQLGALPR